MEANIPHVNQSAYRKKVSCEDAIFSTHEVIAQYLRGGSRVYMCLYDLPKAFDSIEYPVLLKRLYDSGINGKCWCILRNWYAGGFLHGDDIRTLASGLDSYEKQVSIVDKFAKENFLKLNIQKCEIVLFSLSSKPGPVPH